MMLVIWTWSSQIVTLFILQQNTPSFPFINFLPFLSRVRNEWFHILQGRIDHFVYNTFPLHQIKHKSRSGLACVHTTALLLKRVSKLIENHKVQVPLLSIQILPSMIAFIAIFRSWLLRQISIHALFCLYSWYQLRISKWQLYCSCVVFVSGSVASTYCNATKCHPSRAISLTLRSWEISADALDSYQIVFHSHKRSTGVHIWRYNGPQTLVIASIISNTEDGFVACQGVGN